MPGVQPQVRIPTTAAPGTSQLLGEELPARHHLLPSHLVRGGAGEQGPHPGGWTGGCRQAGASLAIPV